jgi:hypothetical protein
MTNTKYQICTKEGVYNFEDKDSFKRQGQIMFNDYSRNKNKTETYFSCDHGRSWIFIVNFGKEKISNFKCLSDKIYEYPFGKSYSKINNTTNSNKSNSSNSSIFFILIIAVGVFFFVKSQENKSSSQTNITNSSTNTDAVGQSTEDSKSSDSQIKSSVSEEQVDNSVSEPQNNEVNNQSESQTYTCLLCEGEGKTLCSTCKGKGQKLCRSCAGRGYKIHQFSGETYGCSTCLNTGIEECEKYTKCAYLTITCGGSGKVDEERHNKQLSIKKSIDEGVDEIEKNIRKGFEN